MKHKGARNRSLQAGMTLLELIIATGVLAILSTAALPTVRFLILRPKERELRGTCAK